MTQPVPALLPERGTLTRHRRPLHALTGIRFFAAIWVVIFHTRVADLLGRAGHPYAAQFFANGSLAVPLFFLLSGFILAYTYRQQIETPSHRVRFWEARFARIWPAYAFSLLCSSIPSFTMPPPGVSLATLLMVQAWDPLNPVYAGAWNIVCWTLSVEALFYITFPWFQVWFERLSLRRLQLLGFLLIAVSIAFHVPIMGLGRANYPGIFHFLPLPVIMLPLFLIGVILGNLFLELNAGKPERNSGWLTYSGLLLSGVIFCTQPETTVSFCLFGLALLLYGLATERTLISRFLSTKLMLLGGGISYSIYLLQGPVRDWVKRIFAAENWGNGRAALLSVPVLLILVSLPTFLFLEEPARKFLRARFAAAERRRSTHALN